jgi:hypothetical protein
MDIDELLAYIFSNTGSWVAVKQSIDNAIPVQFFKVAHEGGRCIKRKVLDIATRDEEALSEPQMRIMFRNTVWEKVPPGGSSLGYRGVVDQS